MPTVLRLLGWRFHFYSDEGHEPPHIHVATVEGECKFWLEPVRLAKAQNIKPHDLRRIELVVWERESFFVEKWHEYQQS